RPFASHTMPKRPQRAPSRGSCATLSRAWRTMSAISGARGPRSATAGGASGLARSARNAAAPASSTAAAAIEIAACRKLKNRRRVGDWVRLDRRVRVTDTRVETRRGGEGRAFAPRAARELPVELRSEPEETRGNDRRRRREARARAPDDVRRRIRVGQVVTVDE